MKTYLDIGKWARKDHFNFFRQFEEPFFGICTTIDCTVACREVKEHDTSLFLYYLYNSLVAANQIEPFRYRMEGEQVIIHDHVDASPTISRPDGTFGFAYIDYAPRLDDFLVIAHREIERIHSEPGLVPANSNENVIHYSSLPWIKFTSLSHARAFGFKESIPKISFGKITEENGRKTLPISIHVHHALMDGYHVGQYLECFQDLMNVDR